MKKRMGQSVLEYAVLVALVSAAFITMGMYVRRATQGRIYSIEDQVSARANATPTGSTGGGSTGGSRGPEPWW